MKLFKMNKREATLFAVLLAGIVGPTLTFAATAPTLGSLETYGVVSSTFTNTSAGTSVSGDVCYTTAPATAPTISGATVVPCNSARETEQNTALTTLNSQACTSLGSNVVLSGTYTPGCYSSTGTMDITLGTTITLNGSGVYIFRPGGAITTGANSRVTLTGGAIASNVYWAPVGATTLGANTVFVGNIFRGTAAGLSITLGNLSTLAGRILAYGSTVTTNANTITVPAVVPSPATLHVIKTVTGGVAIPSAFTIHVKSSGTDVTGSPQAGASTPGTSYSLVAGTYVVSENAFAGYNATFSGDCNSSGSITLTAGQDKTCTINNTDTSLPIPATLHVIKVVVNAGPGVSLPSAFTLHVKSAGVDVAGSPQVGISTPGTSYSLSAGTYVVSENANSLYTSVYSEDCNSVGSITLAAGDDKTCTIVNTDILVLPTGVTGGGYYNAPRPLINVTKIPSPLALPMGAGDVTFTYTLTNVGAVSMRGIWVKDDKCPPVKYISGDTDDDQMLDMTESWTYNCSKTVTETETNTATAHGSANGWDGYDTANATVVVGKSVVPPLINVVKIPNLFLLPASGGAVTYTYIVTNPGTEPLKNVSITDDKCTGLPGRVAGHPGDINKNNLLESNENWTFTCQTYLTKTTTNIGTAIGYANGLSAVDISPVTVVVSTPKLPNAGFPPSAWGIENLIVLCVLTVFSLLFLKESII